MASSTPVSCSLLFPKTYDDESGEGKYVPVPGIGGVPKPLTELMEQQKPFTFSKLQGFYQDLIYFLVNESDEDGFIATRVDRNFPSKGEITLSNGESFTDKGGCDKLFCKRLIQNFVVPTIDSALAFWNTKMLNHVRGVKGASVNAELFTEYCPFTRPISAGDLNCERFRFLTYPSTPKNGKWYVINLRTVGAELSSLFKELFGPSAGFEFKKCCFQHCLSTPNDPKDRRTSVEKVRSEFENSKSKYGDVLQKRLVDSLSCTGGVTLKLSGSDNQKIIPKTRKAISNDDFFKKRMIKQEDFSEKFVLDLTSTDLPSSSSSSSSHSSPSSSSSSSSLKRKATTSPHVKETTFKKPKQTQKQSLLEKQRKANNSNVENAVDEASPHSDGDEVNSLFDTHPMFDVDTLAGYKHSLPLFPNDLNGVGLMDYFFSQIEDDPVERF